MILIGMRNRLLKFAEEVEDVKVRMGEEDIVLDVLNSEP